MDGVPTEVAVDFLGGSPGLRHQSGLRQVVGDGTVAIGAGSAMAAGFGPSIVSGIVTSTYGGVWWFAGLFGAGLVLLTVGAWQRHWVNRHPVVGVLAAAEHQPRGSANFDRAVSLAERYLPDKCTVGVRVFTTLRDDMVHAGPIVDAMAEKIVAAVSNADRLVASAVRVQLIALMPGHAAFRLGARLGHTSANQVTVMGASQEGDPPFFPAIRLADSEGHTSPLLVERMTLDDVASTGAAIAVDLQLKGDEFLVPMLAICRRDGYRHVIILRSQTKTIKNDEYEPVVNQIVRIWREPGTLPAQARESGHGIFVAGPPAIALALGARLAYKHFNLWTPYSFHNGVYETLPPVAPTAS